MVGHNPINLSGGPRRSAINPDDVSTPDLGAVVETLRAAERANTVKPGGRHPLWATEFWWNSDPPHPGAISPAKQGRWIEEALYLFWKAGARRRVALQIADSKNFLRGSRHRPVHRRRDSETGATAFRFPFVTERRADGRLLAWGRAPGGGQGADLGAPGRRLANGGLRARAGGRRVHREAGHRGPREAAREPGRRDQPGLAPARLSAQQPSIGRFAQNL